MFPVGNTEVIFRAPDAADGTATVTVADLTPPAYGEPRISPQPNSRGWHNSKVTVTFPCIDSISGPLEVVRILSQEGANQMASVSAEDCKDRAGNPADTGKEQGGINIDLTSPAYGEPNTSSKPDSRGWHNSDVTVTFPCTDELSRPLDDQVALTLSEEGVNQVAGVSAQECEDLAGNIAVMDGELGGINIDKTAPQKVTKLKSTSHEVSTWSSNNIVGVEWTNSSDSLSQLESYVVTWDTDSNTAVATQRIGTATSANSLPRLDGMFHYFHVQAIDRAGNNSVVASFGPIWIDTTPPDTTVDLIKEGWDVFVEISGSDNFELARFECSLDNGPYENCTIPDKSKVAQRKHRLSVNVDGPYTLKVRAIDGTGNLELDPAEVSWC